MLRCSRCGTLNVDGNSFCSSCGMKLARTSIRCPKCGTSNRVGNIFCDKCQAKLISPDTVVPPEESDVSVATVKGISLPTRMKTDEAPVMPDWLQQLTDNVRTESFEEASEEENITLAIDNQPTPELPDWLTDLVEQDDELVTGNVREIESDTDSTFKGQDLPDWLLAGQDSVLQSNSELDTASADSIDHLQASDASSEDLPDWLSDIADEGNEPVALSEGPSDWLFALAEDVDTPDIPSDHPLTDGIEHVLDTDSGEVTAASVKATGLPAGEEQAVEELDWLLDNTEDANKQQRILGKRKLIPSAENLGIPGTIGSKAESKTQLDNDIGNTPDWMSIVVSDSGFEDNPIREKDAPFSTGVPDHLNLTGKESFSTEQPDTPQQSRQPVVSNEELPAWLSELNAAQSKVAESQAVFTPESADSLTTEVRKPDAPAWLEEVTPPSGIIALQPTAPALIMPEEPSSIQTEPTVDQEVPNDEAFPSWLNELRITEPGSVTDYTKKRADFSTAAGVSTDIVRELPEADTDELVRADLPEWLQYLKPPEGSAWTPVADLSTKEAVEAGNLSPAEVPEWVQTLRPKPGEQKEVSSDGVLAPEPAETEGPLASLVGILPTSTAVDMPADYEVNLVKIPASVIQQAQLWQQLLEQPASTARTVVHPEARYGFNLTLIRLVIAAAFILGSFVALWLLPTSNLAFTASTVTSQGLQKFITSVESLQPGETVIVAIEYGWAQADEMTTIAHAVLSHLADLEVNVIAVSTMPEGAAMISNLLESHELSNGRLGSTSYLSSSAAGIADFLGMPEAQSASMLIVLSSHYEKLRWWLEQNQTVASATSRPPLPVNVGLSASTGPLAAPYLNTRNTQGWVIGFQGSIDYHTQRGSQNPAQVHIRDVLMIMHWGVVILLITGFLYTLISGKTGA